ncbi:helix-turn-helix domain-containing protein [Actinokineospora sp. NPDC004072]
MISETDAGRLGPVIDTRSMTYTVEEVAALLNLSRGVTYAHVRSGAIPAIRLGRRWLVPRDRFHTWLDGRTEG